MRTSHQYELWASNLLYLAFATSIGFEVYLRKGIFSKSGGFLTGLDGVGYLILASSIAFFLALIHFIRQGKTAAKYLYFVIFTFDILDTLDAAILSNLTSYLGVVNFVTRQVLANGAAILLLLSLLSLRVTHKKVLLAVAVTGFLMGIFYIHVVLEHANHPPENFEY